MRGQQWLEWAALHVDDSRESTVASYQEFLDKDQIQDVSEVCVQQIEKDLPRTWSALVPELSQETELTEQLRRILCAVAHFQRPHGYAQSMNFICGIVIYHLRSHYHGAVHCSSQRSWQECARNSRG